MICASPGKRSLSERLCRRHITLRSLAHSVAAVLPPHAAGALQRILTVPSGAEVSRSGLLMDQVGGCRGGMVAEA